VIELFRTLWPQHLFRDKGILPTPLLLWLSLGLTIPGALAAWLGLGWLPFWGLNTLLFLASMLDLWLLPRRQRFTCSRSISAEVERGLPFQTVLQLSNHSRSSLRFQLIDNLPETFASPFPLQGELPGSQTLELPYPSQAAVRGDYLLDKVFFRYRSGLSLWKKQITFSIINQVKVIPDMSKVRGYLATAQKQLLDEGRKVLHQQVGSGEFAQIRAYVPGDDPRKINWRQTAKLSELMTNVYEPEHGKYVTLLLDCGRTMGVEVSQGNRLERAVEAALCVAAIALRQGDYVSVLAFSNTIKAYVPPGKSMAHLRTILQAVYNLSFDAAESDYNKAFLHLETVQKRQSFLLLFSDLDSFLYEATPPFYLQRVSRRYRFLLLGIADPMTAGLVRTLSKDTKQAMVKTIAQKEVLHKQQAMKRWGRQNVQLLEVPEEQLATAAVSHYITLINRGTL